MSRCSSLAGRSQIGKQVEAVLAALRKGGTDAGAEAALYATVVGPMASVVSSKTRLTIVPDGPLYQLPLEMLGPRPDQRLLASHVVTYAPSGTVFTLLSEKKGSRPSLPLLAVATGTDSLAEARARMADQQQRSGTLTARSSTPAISAQTFAGRQRRGSDGSRNAGRGLCDAVSGCCNGKRLEKATARTVPRASFCCPWPCEHEIS